LGGSYKGRSVGTLADLNTFSLHPVKHITSGEGGLITTNDSGLARKMRQFRNHGITTDHRERSEQGSWFYEMVDLGFNYRLTDIQCALAISQLKKLNGWVERRQQISRIYDAGFGKMQGIMPLTVQPDVSHAYHLYVVRIDSELLGVDRSAVFNALRADGIGVNVHYVPVHLHPYYQKNYDTRPGQCPVAEQAYQEILSLPMFPMMGDDDATRVVESIRTIVGAAN
jgi:perosamine synthetase